MRSAHSTQLRLDCQPIQDMQFNLECRDEIVPILFALQQLYLNTELRDEILDWVAQDVNGDSRGDRGRTGFRYWQIVVLAAVRLGCNFDYDRLQNLAEQHAQLRCLLQQEDWDPRDSLKWSRIRDNVCKVRPETIDRISARIVAMGHRIQPTAAAVSRADSFVVETNAHHPTESSLMWDGARTLLDWGVSLADDLGLTSFRQYAYLRKKIKNLHHTISRVAASRAKDSRKQLRKLYQKLIERTEHVLQLAGALVTQVPAGNLRHFLQAQKIATFIERTQQVVGTSRRRVLAGERVPNGDKLFSLFEPHTQLYQRGKASDPLQFGRLLLVYEDAAGFVTHHKVLDREAADADVAVEETRIVQTKLKGAIQKLSFDRGFDSRLNRSGLQEIVEQVCLPRKGPAAFVKQLHEEDEEFHAQRRYHGGVESAIGALQRGNALKRCRDRSELGFERYVSLAILGRNLHTLGRMLIAQQSPDSAAAYSQRQAA